MTPYPRLQGIIFDLGDTLVSVELRPTAGVERLYELGRNPRSVPLEAVLAEYNDILADVRKLWGAGWETGNRYQLNRNMFERFGITFDLPEDILDLEYCIAIHDLEPLPGVLEMLAELSARGIAMGILSNSMIGGTSLRTVMGRIGILKYVRFLMSSADYGFAKPHPQIFRTALAKLGTPAENTFFIGDMPEFDVFGAEAVGMTGIWYNPAGKSCDPPVPTHIITDWGELLGIER